MPISAILAAALVLLVSQSARADMEVTFQEDSGPVVTVATDLVNFDPSGVSFNGSFGNFQVRMFGSTSDNTAAYSNLMTSQNALINTDAVAHTLTIGVTQTDYTLPGTNGSLLDMTSNIMGLVTAGGAGQALTFQSYASNSILDFDTSGVTTGPQTPAINVSHTPFDAPPASAAFPRTSNMYTVTTYTTITLAPGGYIGFQTSTTLVSTPVPQGLVLALTALPALGLGAWLHGRRKKVPFELQNAA